MKNGKKMIIKLFTLFSSTSSSDIEYALADLEKLFQ